MLPHGSHFRASLCITPHCLVIRTGSHKMRAAQTASQGDTALDGVLTVLDLPTSHLLGAQGPCPVQMIPSSQGRRSKARIALTPLPPGPCHGLSL